MPCGTVHLRKDVRSERKGCAGPSSEETFSRILPAARGRHDFSQRGTRRSREDGRDDALRAQRQTARKHARNTLRTVQRADAPKAFAPAEAGPSVPGGASGRTRRPESPLPFSTGSRKRSTDARGYATPAYGGGGMGPHGGKGQCPAQGGEESDDGGAGSNTTTSRAQRRETSELRPEADQRPALASARRRADNRGRSRRGHSAIFGVMRTGHRERAAPVPSAKTGKRTFPVRHTKKAPRCEHRGAEGSSQTSNAEDAGHAAWLR